MSIFDFLRRSIEPSHQREINAIARERGLTTAQAEQAWELDQEAEDQARQRRADERCRKNEAKRADEQGYRAQLGETLGLGVPIHYGHIIVIGGLRERYRGPARVRNTVYHVVLDAPFQRGCLIRNANDLLCRSRPPGPSNEFVSGCGTWHPNDILEDWWHDVEINCTRCCEILARFAAGDD